MTREDYAREYSGGHAMNGKSVTVPANVERVAFHTPCLLCGSARECRHRRAA